MGVRHLTMVDRFGIIASDMDGLNDAHREIAQVTNLEGRHGTLADAMAGADVFIGVSAPNIVSREMVASMAPDAIVFPMANPTPEIMPDEALSAGARIVGTGRSDFPNQINNVLAFPGIFRGALDCRASCINEEMKVATSFALAALIPDEELNERNIIAPALDKRVAKNRCRGRCKSGTRNRRRPYLKYCNRLRPINWVRVRGIILKSQES